MKVVPLDEETYGLCVYALGRARGVGADPIEELHRAGLIANPALITQVQLDAITTLIKMLEEAQPHELLRRKFKAGAACTPGDMVVAVLDYIREYREMIKKDGP
jgi:hypothetical protein